MPSRPQPHQPMNIKIKSLRLENFKCFRNREFSFDSDIVTVYGSNGSGKTTIADAIHFCLFGKNTAGQSDLDIFKTRSEGRILPNLDHSVQLVLSVATQSQLKEVTLRRTIKEVWVKKRGSDEQVFKNNTVEYYVDGEAYTAADYKKYISSLISEDTFRAITNPTYFPSLKWQEQREFLKSMAGDIPAPDDVRYAALLKQLSDSGEDIIAYRKHLSYKMKEIRKRLDLIPTRLEEQHKALPPLLDWQSLQVQSVATQSQLKDLESQILKASSGSSSDIKRKELTAQKRSVQRDLDAIATEHEQRYQAAEQEKRKAVNEQSVKFQTALNNQRLMEQKIEADHRLIERCQSTDYEAELQRLRDQWPKETFKADPSVSFCPTCGQPLPDEDINKKLEEMRRNFNLQKEARKKEINEQAARIKKQQADAIAERELLEHTLQDDEQALAAIKKEITSIFMSKADIEKKEIPPVSVTLEADVQYVALSKQLTSIETQLSSLTDEDTPDVLTSLESQRSECAALLAQLNTQLATKPQYDRIQYLIEGINAEQRDLVTQLSALEQQEDIASSYQSAQNAILEDRINAHFSLVSWRLTRTVNNGGDSFEEPFCECYVDGIAYHAGLNQAARLNAGLDICNALCHFFSVSAPIVIDNAEAVNNILSTTGQQLRLYVSDSELTIK